MTLSDLIRFGITAVILFQVCRESNFWTSITIGGIAISNELLSYRIRCQRERLASVSFRLMLLEERGATQ